MSSFHKLLIEFLFLINWKSPFPFLGLLGGTFRFYSDFNRAFCKQTVETLIRRHILMYLIWRQAYMGQLFSP